jgi:hypothetical protein
MAFIHLMKDEGPRTKAYLDPSVKLRTGLAERTRYQPFVLRP